LRETAGSTDLRPLIEEVGGANAIRLVTLSPELAAATQSLLWLRAPTVAIVGLGYVGLPTALALASGGAPVIGIDSSASRLKAIRERKVDLLAADHDRLRDLL